MKIDTKFKTLINKDGNYRVIDDRSSADIYTCSAPNLMGMSVTVDSLKECYPNINFDKLELIIVNIKKEDENNI